MSRITDSELQRLTSLEYPTTEDYLELTGDFSRKPKFKNDSKHGYKSYAQSRAYDNNKRRLKYERELQRRELLKAFNVKRDYAEQMAEIEEVIEVVASKPTLFGKLIAWLKS